jgi:hypothetical protein
MGTAKKFLQGVRVKGWEDVNQRIVYKLQKSGVLVYPQTGKLHI